MRDRLKAELKVITSLLIDPEDIKAGDYGDTLIEILEQDADALRVTLDEAGVDGEMGRAQVIWAVGFVNGVAQERDLSITELFDEEDLP